MSESAVHSLGCRTIGPLGVDDELSDNVLFRIVRGDEKGRPFGTPRNPRVPTREEFNPLLGELEAGQLESRIGDRRHGPLAEQAERIRQFSNEDLIRFRPEDPISGHAGNGIFSITGEHHRLDEIIRRVPQEELPAETPIRI